MFFKKLIKNKNILLIFLGILLTDYIFFISFIKYIKYIYIEYNFIFLFLYFFIFIYSFYEITKKEFWANKHYKKKNNFYLPYSIFNNSKYLFMFFILDFFNFFKNIKNTYKYLPIIFILLLISPIFILTYFFWFNLFLSKLINAFVFNHTENWIIKQPFPKLETDFKSLLQIIFQKIPKKIIFLLFYKKLNFNFKNISIILDNLILRYIISCPRWLLFYVYNYSIIILDTYKNSSLQYKKYKYRLKIFFDNLVINIYHYLSTNYIWIFDHTLQFKITIENRKIKINPYFIDIMKEIHNELLKKPELNQFLVKNGTALLGKKSLKPHNARFISKSEDNQKYSLVEVDTTKNRIFGNLQPIIQQKESYNTTTSFINNNWLDCKLRTKILEYNNINNKFKLKADNFFTTILIPQTIKNNPTQLMLQPDLNSKYVDIDSKEFKEKIDYNTQDYLNYYDNSIDNTINDVIFKYFCIEKNIPFFMLKKNVIIESKEFLGYKKQQLDQINKINIYDKTFHFWDNILEYEKIIQNKNKNLDDLLNQNFDSNNDNNDLFNYLLNKY